MKNLFLILIFWLSSFTGVIAQQYEDSSNHGNWRYLYGDKHMYLYSIKGVGVENFSDIPDFTIRFEKNKEGDMDIRLDAASIYSYDDAGEKNYVGVDIIIDDGEIMSFKGQIFKLMDKDETRVYIYSMKDGTRYADLFEDMKKGNNLFIRTTGATEPIVLKYSLAGFSSGFDKLYNSWDEWRQTNIFDNSENPFKEKNPFKK